MLTVCVRVIVTIIMSNRYGTNKGIYMVLKKDVIHVYWSYLIIIIIEGLSLLQSIPPTTADKQTQVYWSYLNKDNNPKLATPYM